MRDNSARTGGGLTQFGSLYYHFSILAVTETLERKQPITLFQPNRVHLTRIATEREQSLNTNLMLRPLLRFRDEIFDTFSPVKSSPTSKKTQKGSRAYNSSSSLKLKKKGQRVKTERYA